MSADQEREIESNSNNECRTCLQTTDTVGLIFLFQNWSPGWIGMENTIAEDLAKVTNIQVSESDSHSKFICYSCSDQLKQACQFISLVRNNDTILRLRNPPANNDTSSSEVWPRPIQVNKTIPMDDFLDVNVKQEALSDDEYNGNIEDGYREVDYSDQIDIKVEPEEILGPSTPQIIFNGAAEYNTDTNNQNNTLENGELHYDDKLLNTKVKQEPESDPEDSDISPSDMSLECLLCTKSFLSVSGLKAHVIAQHSYKTVKRRTGNRSPQKQPQTKHICGTCKRTFLTSTDLMVHETCHNKDVCYGCNSKFDTFEKLSAHRRTCKALNNKEPSKPKTLEDVIRSQTEETIKKEEVDTFVTKTEKIEMLTCEICKEQFSDSYYMKIHQEIHHSKESTNIKLSNGPVPMEIEALKNIFNEDT